MTEVNTFVEALSDRMTSTAYGVYDAAREIEQDIPVAMVAGAEVIAELAHSLEAVPNEVLSEAQRWLMTVGVHEFDTHLTMAFSQIITNAFYPSDATEFLQGFNGAMTKKFGLIPKQDEHDETSVIVLEFWNQSSFVDLTSSDTSSVRP